MGEGGNIDATEEYNWKYECFTPSQTEKFNSPECKWSIFKVFIMLKTTPSTVLCKYVTIVDVSMYSNEYLNRIIVVPFDYIESVLEIMTC